MKRPPTISGRALLHFECRWTYEITDEMAILEAGRSAYRWVWPGDDPAAAERDVTHIGRALYMVAHARGWDALRRLPGLVPTGATAVMHAQPEPLSGHPTQWPQELFSIDTEIL
jgi:hypothetical protein